MREIICTGCNNSLFISEEHFHSSEVVFDCSSCGSAIKQNENGQWLVFAETELENECQSTLESIDLKCLQCNSTDIVKNVRAVDRSHSNSINDLKLEVYENPNALFFKGVYEGRLKANICVDCGFVMWNISVIEARSLKRHQNKNIKR